MIEIEIERESMKGFKECVIMKRQRTHRLAENWVFDAVDASGKHSECQSCVETEVQKHVPSFPADPNCTVTERTYNTVVCGLRLTLKPFQELF